MTSNPTLRNRAALFVVALAALTLIITPLSRSADAALLVEQPNQDSTYSSTINDPEVAQIFKATGTSLGALEFSADFQAGNTCLASEFRIVAQIYNTLDPNDGAVTGSFIKDVMGYDTNYSRPQVCDAPFVNDCGELTRNFSEGVPARTGWNFEDPVPTIVGQYYYVELTALCGPGFGMDWGYDSTNPYPDGSMSVGGVSNGINRPNDDLLFAVYDGPDLSGNQVPLRQLTSTDFGLSLSPATSGDGSRVVFISNADHAGENPGNLTELYGVDSDGANLQKLTTNAPPFHFGNGEPLGINGNGSTGAFLSGGDPFGSNGDGNVEVFTVGGDGSGLQQLTSSAAAVKNENVSITTDGSTVAFVSTGNYTGGNADGSREVFTVSSDGATFRQLTDNVGATVDVARISGDGSTVAFTAFDVFGKRSLYIVDTASLAVTLIHADVTVANEPAFALDVSDDGAWIVLAGTFNPTGGNPTGSYRPFSLRSDSSAVHQLTDDFSLMAAMSGDASTVVFGAGGELRAVDIDGANPRVVFVGSGSVSPNSLSVNGDVLVFESQTDPLGTNPELNSEIFAHGPSAPTTGTIIIDKVTDPPGDPQSFSFTLTGGPSNLNQSFSLTDAETPHNSGPVEPGSGYNASETVPAGWDLSATCDDGSPIGNIDVSPGETVTCTFTNTEITPPGGTITIGKDATPNSPQDFSFSGNLGAFDLDNDSDPTLSSIANFDVEVGAYMITEGQVPGWSLVDVACGDPDNESTTALLDRSATVDLDTDEDVICVFSNRQEYEVFGQLANESYIAADPTDQTHAVAAFNDFGSVHCGWSESNDSGLNWNIGRVQFPAGFNPLGDPWVRFAPDGTLLYSCLAATPWQIQGPNIIPLVLLQRTVGVFVAASSSGSASNLGIANPVFTSTQTCVLPTKDFLFDECDVLEEGAFTDHPGIAVFARPGGGWRAVACWVDFFGTVNAKNGDKEKKEKTVSTFLRVAYSDDGAAWSNPKTLAGKEAHVCHVGSSDSEVAVSWWNAHDGTLELISSADGKKWGKPIVLASVGELVSGTPGGFRNSTTSRVLSVPYAQIVGTSNGLRAVYQVRVDNDHSQVYVADSSVGWAPRAIGDPGTETFLPGTGTCPQLVGAYEAISPSGGFHYVVWHVDESDDLVQLFKSGAELFGEDGGFDSRFTLPRIGEYTGVDCSGDTGWAAWTDTRSGQAAIWGTVVPAGA